MRRSRPRQARRRRAGPQRMAMPASAIRAPTMAQNREPVMKLPGRMRMPCRNQTPPVPIITRPSTVGRQRTLPPPACELSDDPEARQEVLSQQLAQFLLVESRGEPPASEVRPRSRRPLPLQDPRSSLGIDDAPAYAQSPPRCCPSNSRLIAPCGRLTAQDRGEESLGIRCRIPLPKSLAKREPKVCWAKPAPGGTEHRETSPMVGGSGAVPGSRHPQQFVRGGTNC